LKDSKATRKSSVRSKKPEPPRKKAPVERPPNQERAIEEFAAALKHFQKRDLAKAKELLEEILEKHVGESEIIDKVYTYLQVCERGLHPTMPRLKDADDFYHQGVYLMNRQEYDEAIRMFDRALGADPSSDKTLYALAAAYALSGRSVEAIEALRRAIAANHANRARAANDSDFDPVRDHQEFVGLIRGERGAEA